jgi:hypothetical protein
MQFSKRNVISVDKSSSESEEDEIKTIKMLNHKSPFMKLKMIGKIQSQIEKFIYKDNFSPLDKNLLKGVYMKNTMRKA